MNTLTRRQIKYDRFDYGKALRKINTMPTEYHIAIEKAGKPLSENEQRLHDAFLKIVSTSYIGEAIRNSFVDYTDTKFRELYCELLSQHDDNKDMVYRIIGQPAYDLLLAVKKEI